ncbi:MAG: hypothetical protein ACI8TP_000192 [Acidimicrobiales bacterium]|jgi:hypothetical protein
MIPTRLTWMAVGAGVSYLSKRKAEQSVDRATEKIEERLPPSLARAADALPAEVVRTAGAVVAAAGAARTSFMIAKGAAGATSTAVSMTRTATGGARSIGASVAGTRRAVNDKISNATSDLRVQTELDRRELKAQYVQQTEGDGPALEARLDLRNVSDDELPEVPDPVADGRRRFRPSLPAAPVNRVQRSYQRPRKPWDR